MKRVTNLLSQLDLIQSGIVIVIDSFNTYFLCDIMHLCKVHEYSLFTFIL